jgi:4-amino-4-deoxy-L-arabinose transferase-like glycosyltransferase
MPRSYRERLWRFIQQYDIEIFLFVLALCVRLFLISIVPHEEYASYWIGSDAKDFINIANNLLHGHGFSRAYEAPFIPDASRTPLYPLFLAGVYSLFGTYFAAIVIQAVLSSALPVLFVRIAKLYTARRSLLIIGGLVVALELHVLYYTTFYASEALSIPLLTWGLYEFLLLLRHETYRSVRVGAVAVLFALATLARPITVYLPLAVLPLFAWRGYVRHKIVSNLKVFAVLTVLFFIVLSPWVIRNYTIFGKAGVDTNGWFNMYTRLAATVVAIDTKQEYYTAMYQLLDELSVRGYIAHPPPVSELEVRDPRFADIFKKETIRILGEHKKAFALFLATAPISVLTQDNTLGFLSSFHPFEYAHPTFSPTLYASQYGVGALIRAVLPFLFGPYIVPYLMRLFFVLLFIASALGTVTLVRQGKKFEAATLFGLILYIVVLSTVSAAQISGRYRAQFFIPETVLALVWFDALSKKRFARATAKTDTIPS